MGGRSEWWLSRNAWESNILGALNVYGPQTIAQLAERVARSWTPEGEPISPSDLARTRYRVREMGLYPRDPDERPAVYEYPRY